MKTIATTLAIVLASCVAFGLRAQTRTPAPASGADTVLLSQTVEGDYTILRYRITRPGDTGYSILYRINLAQLNTKLDGNSQELSQLGTFMERLTGDTTMHVQSILIKGYASPDGPRAFNERLARLRAQDFKTYVDRRYNLSRKYSVRTSYEADDWSDARSRIEASAIPDKAAVLRAIAATGSQADIEKALKQMQPAVWEYMSQHILPPMRRVEMTVEYREGRIVEERKLNRPATPTPTPPPAAPATPPARQPQYGTSQDCPPMPCDEIIIDEQINGIIVEMPNDVG